MQILPGQTKKHSAPVQPSEYRTIAKLAKDMAFLCTKPLGRKPYAYALAHCQVDQDNPKRFFVMIDGEIVINPSIKAGKGSTFLSEGCMSFPMREDKKVKRFEKVLVTYQNDQGEELEEEFDGLWARIFQHEIDHMNGVSIYSK